MRAVQLGGELAHTVVHARGPGRIQGQAQILGHKIDREARSVLVARRAAFLHTGPGVVHLQ